MFIGYVVVDTAVSAGDIVDMDDAGKRAGRVELRHDIVRGSQLLRCVMDRLPVPEDRGIQDPRLHEVLEDVAPEGQLRVIPDLRLFGLTDDLEGADVGKRRRHPELRRGGAHPPGDDQHHMPAHVTVVPVDLSDQLGHLIFVFVGKLIIAERVDQNDRVHARQTRNVTTTVTPIPPIQPKRNAVI